MRYFATVSILALLACVGSFALVWGAGLASEAEVGSRLRAQASGLAAGTAISVAVAAGVLAAARRWTLRRALQILFAVLFVGVASNLAWLQGPLQSYGDAGYLSGLLERGEVFARWLLGSRILGELYPLWSGSAEALLPASLGDAEAFVRLAGALTMLGASLYLLDGHGDHLGAILPMATPVWLLFSSGYPEYYPFVAGAFLWTTLRLCEGASAGWHPLRTATLAALLAVAYAGFVPLALLVLVVYAAEAGWRPAGVAAAAALPIALGAVWLLWDGAPSAFPPAYLQALNLGETNTLHPPYRGEASAPYSPFFGVGYALGAEHLRHLLFMFVYGAGPLVPLLAAGGLVALRRRRARPLLGDSGRPWVLGLLATLALLYFLFMIPKLGPARDIDLFFPVYLTASAAAGFLLEGAMQPLDAGTRSRLRDGIVAVVLGSTGAMLTQLLFLGLVPDGGPR